jgi:hypothetical protein
MSQCLAETAGAADGVDTDCYGKSQHVTTGGPRVEQLVLTPLPALT